MVLYTDGITEAMNNRMEMFDEDRLGQLICQNGHTKSVDLREQIIRSVQTFTDGIPQQDDMTLIVMRVN